MIAGRYSSFVVFLIFLSISLISVASERSASHSTTVNDDESKIESNDDEYIDPKKYHKASYRHEQSLLANIYAPGRTYISMHDDRIHPSNFSYFTFNNLGTYRLVLISLRGDADLYISTSHKHVTYDNYEYSSCTCGIDEILIDSYLKRPIYIGIYGYSQYQISHYRLLIELVDSRTELDPTFFEQSDADNAHSTVHEQETSHTNQKISGVVTKNENDGQSPLWTLLSFLLEVLEIFA